ncbi:MAG: ATP-dependent zinc metalloprotease FtsH [Clostridia bacterium]|nr:ATP-dependent zinc metalloprotease FtsH [Clostridia bacterium]
MENKNLGKEPNEGENSEFKPPRIPGGLIFYAVIIVLIIILSYTVLRTNNTTKRENLSDLYEYINDESYDVESVIINGNTVQLTYTDAKYNDKLTITRKIPMVSVDRLLEKLEEEKQAGHIEYYDYTEPVDISTIVNIIICIGSCVLVFLIFKSIAKQSKDNNSVFSFGNNRAKLTKPNQMKIRFTDVAGCDEEKEELAEVVDFLKNPAKYHELGAKIPKGVILYGAAGTGKTLLAKAVAGEAGVPFFYISGSDFVEMLVGVGSSRVRSLFADAKKASPSVVFIDEIDAVGRKRGAGLGGGNDEREQTLNQILVEMDGFNDNTNVIVIAATNRVDILDPALLRAGRFDRKVMVMPPDANGREAVLKIHARGKKFTDEVDFHELALSTVGFTGADLENLLNESALLAARRNKKKITPLEVNDAMFRVMMGPEKTSKKLTDKSKKLTAYHEAGHAIVLRALSETEKVDRVTIIPAGSAGGFTAYKPKEDYDFQTKKMLLTSIKVSLGGRAAEEIFLGEISTGAMSDLQHCNRVATNMIKRFGLSDKFPNLVFGDDNEEVFIGSSFGQVQSYSDKTAYEIDEEIKNIIDNCYKETLEVLRTKSSTVEGLATRLMDVLKVDGPEFEKIYENNGDLSFLNEKSAASEEVTAVDEGIAEAEAVINSDDNKSESEADSKSEE